jgi:ferredoxin--NADP+ reductase
VVQRLRAGQQHTTPGAGESILASAAPLGAAVLLAGAAAGGRSAVSSVARRAAAVKKKGVRVVEGKEIPWNLFSPKAPYTGKVVGNHKHPQTLTSDTGDANWETCHVTFDHDGKVPYIEGQSIGVIAPGPDKKGETPAKIRLYSIASSAVGDDETSKTVSLCVKRVVEVDGQHANREVGEDKPDKAGTCFPESKVYRGVCSNHINDMSPGDDVLITGPTGAEMLLPEDQNSNIIMLATGTGIAPMRSYCRLLFNDAAGANADGSRKFQGLAWLFMGVPYSKSLLYDDEHLEYAAKYPGQWRHDYAVSREDKNAAGQKMYIQTKMAEYAEELWELMQKENTHIYMCGLKGMEAGMAECFSDIAEKNGLVWADFAKKMKKDKRYHVEVY